MRARDGPPAPEAAATEGTEAVTTLVSFSTSEYFDRGTRSERRDIQFTIEGGRLVAYFPAGCAKDGIPFKLYFDAAPAEVAELMCKLTGYRQ